jgi:hypothetical protein
MVKDILIKLGLTSGDFKKGLNEAGNAADDFSKKTDKASKSTSDLLDAGEEMPGVMGRAASGIKGLIGTVKTLATTLLANPIGIIITAIAVAAASLYAIFKDFAPLTDLIADKFARLQGAFSGLQTAVYNFTQGLGFNTKAINDQADAAERASKMLRDYEDNLSSFNLKQAQYEAQIDKLLKQAKNKSISDKQANELIKEATRLQNLQIESLKNNQRIETSILVERAKAAGATYQQILAIQKGATIESLNNVQNGADDELRALQENYTKRVEAVGSLEEKREKINNAQAALDEKRRAKAEKAEADRIKAAEEEKARLDAELKERETKDKEEAARLAEIAKNEKERKKSLIESEREEYAANIADLKAIKDDDLLADIERFAAIEELEAKGVLTAQEAADAKIAIAQKEKDAKAALLNAYSQILSTASDLAGKDTAMGKALAVASATISTYSAIAGQLAVHSKPGAPPIPGYAIAQAIATGVAGFAAVKNILSVKVPGGGGAGGGGGSMPTMNLPSTRPSSGFTMLGNEDPIRTTNEGGKIKVFVTESDITNSQNKVSSIQAKATIG